MKQLDESLKLTTNELSIPLAI